MLLPILACLFSCGPGPVTVSVEAHGKPPPAPGAQVVLVPADPRIPTSDPTYVYLTKVVSEALTKTGLRPTTAAGADRSILAISIGWELDPPKVIVPVAPTMQNGNFRGVPPGLHPGTLRSTSGETDLSDLGTGMETAESRSVKITRYPWVLELKGVDQSSSVAKVLWSVTATADGPSNDPSDVAPQLLTAGVPLIGTETRRKTVKLSAGDAAVKALVADNPKAGPAASVNARP